MHAEARWCCDGWNERWHRRCPVFFFFFFFHFSLALWCTSFMFKARQFTVKEVLLLTITRLVCKRDEPYSPFQKNWSLTTTTCRLIRAQTVADPNMVFAYWSKKKKTMFGAKTIALSWFWVLFPAAAVWTPLCVAAQSTSFLLLSIFRFHAVIFQGGVVR